MPREKRHVKSTYSNATPATDGQVVVAFFGSHGLYAYDLNGKPLGQVVTDIRQAIARAGAPPRGISVNNRGQVPAFEETLTGLRGAYAVRD